MWRRAVRDRLAASKAQIRGDRMNFDIKTEQLSDDAFVIAL
ncbi:MAG: hypothetical protein QOG06_940, partial [Gaiellaceae bacterium]|nr:hypothetical protein [Gaiellaceae bacterium]